MTESVVHFGPGERLLGVLTPTAPVGGAGPDDRPMVVFLNAGIIHHVGPNRIHVRLARSLAKAGYASFRFDLAGIGDSLPLDTRESVNDEHLHCVEEALDTLENKGLASRFVLFGLCSGATLGFQVATRDPRVVGLVFIDPPTMVRTWRYYLVRGMSTARRPRVWVRFLRGRYGVLKLLQRRMEAAFGRKEKSKGEIPEAEVMARAREGLNALSKRGFQLFLIVTGSLSDLFNYREQFFDLFPDIDLKRFTRVEYLPSTDHTFSQEASRRRLTSDLLDWVKSVR